MSTWIDFRLKNMLFMLEVVYRENEELQNTAENAIQKIIQLLEKLNTELLKAIEDLPSLCDNSISMAYSHPKKIEISCTTPHARTYLILLKNFDSLVQQCDLLWLTGQWNREESREPVKLWTRTISKGIYHCAGHFLPLRRKYIQYHKTQHQSDETQESTDQP
ncbi:AcaB family transcriptional regulator [Endozoicomonas arenosclerae]|uniref:AcaB family transcriptional regulator n=1 Tax=Endozoicomonas arenosclerae TaxID=1633495 RepID=UPI00078112FA|nr:AcaB family transcriptional regulator [Endozoicomonas arenosclerae]